MDKRLPIVLALCLLIMLGWSYLFPPPRPPVAAPAGAIAESIDTSAPSATASDSSGATSTSAHPRRVDAEERTLTVLVGESGKPGHYRAQFTNRGAALTELRTGNYFDRVDLAPEERADVEHWTRLLEPVTANGKTTASMVVRANASAQKFVTAPLESELWTMQPLGPADRPNGVEFRLAPGTGVTFVKRYTFVPEVDEIRVDFELENEALDDRGSLAFVLTPAACVTAVSGDPWYLEPQAVASSQANSKEPPKVFVETRDERGKVLAGDFSIRIGEPVTFVGVYNKYFAVLVHGSDAASAAALDGATWRRLVDDRWIAEHPSERDHGTRQIVADVHFNMPLPERGAKSSVSFDLYAGPKDRTALEASLPAHSALVQHDLGFFSGIASVLLVVLNAFESLTGNWGIAIILLTVSVKLLLFPINRRSQTAMARYQSKIKRLQPKIDEIKKTYPNDVSRQRQEQAKLMQAEGAFPPLGGCLPMFLQIPVFIGLYRALGVSFDLRHAPFFFWIRDLSVPDQLMYLGFDTHLPLIGTIAYLNILPPLMVALWIWQQKGMPMPADEQAARMQKMMMWMPVLMGVFLYNYAAGLSLYMITQSGIGVIEQKVIRKYWPVDDKELPPKKSGFMARLMQAQQAQMKKMEAQRRRPKAKKVGR